MTLPEKPTSESNLITDFQKKSLGVFSAVAAIGSWSLLVTYLIGYFFTSDQRYLYISGIDIVLAAFLTLSWLLQRRGQHDRSAWILGISAFVMIAIFQFFVARVGLITGIIVPLIFISIAWQTFRSQNAIRMTIIAVVAGISYVVIDTYLAPGGRIVATLIFQEIIIVIGGVIFFILLLNWLEGIEFNSVGAQIRTAFLIISVAPILIVAIPQIMASINLLNEQSNASLERSVTTIADSLDNDFTDIVAEIKEDSILPNIVSFLKDPTINSNIVNSVARRYPSVLSYALLDKNGQNLLDSSEKEAGKNESQTAYFQGAINSPNTYISDVVLDPDTGGSVFYVGNQVTDELGRPIGIIRIKFDAQMLQEIVEESAKNLGTGIVVAIIDEENIILAHSGTPDLRSQILVFPSPDKLLVLQKAGRLPAVPTNPNLGDLAQNLKSVKETTSFQSKTSPEDTSPDNVSVTTLYNKPWKVLVGIHLTTFLVPVLTQAGTTMAILLVVLLAVFFGANLTTGLLVTPINKLASAAKALGAGELDTSIRLARKDEFGTLSSVLDDTARQLNDTLQTLETRVAERTMELSEVNEKNARRAAQLEAIAQVARSVTSLSDPEKLLPEITQQISKSFGYYHSGIFLVDESGEYAVLRASNSDGGKKMLKRSHRLKVGREGIVGFVSNTGRHRIALDVGDDAVFFTNPDLPETRSEIALPLKIGDRVIGVLDVQSTEPEAFNEEDVRILTLLSDQLSIAIENARLFEETNEALKQVQGFYAEASGMGWRALLSDSGSTGFRFIKGNVEPIFQNIEKVPTYTSELPLELPIILRGERLGGLKIRQPGRTRPWTETEIRMYQSIVDRMTFALENARLFSDARKRANIERLTADASTKISSSVQYETILRTAAEEISRILGGSDVLVQIQPESVDKNDTSQ
jgi:GAF domain-containing protein/HAMP domain-containing protein